MSAVVTAELVAHKRPRVRQRGDWKVFRLSEPVTCDDVKFGYIVVSAVVAYSGPETFVFPADADGKVINWHELPGSFVGRLDHDDALRGFLNYCNGGEDS